MNSENEFAVLFRDHLREHGYAPRPGISEKAVAAFEMQHRVRLPEDFRAYLRVTNGTAENGDDWATSFFRLDEVCPIVCVDDRYFAFADQMISAPAFAISLGNGIPWVVRYWGNNLSVEPISDSFSSFARLFMEGPSRIHTHCYTDSVRGSADVPKS